MSTERSSPSANYRRRNRALWPYALVAAISGLALIWAFAAQAEPAQNVKVKPVANYIVDTNLVVTKVCIGDQAYLITRQSNGASGITPALREGKPELCDSVSGSKQSE